MSEIKLADGRSIVEYGQPYIIAEVNSSHNGDVDVAKQMIDAAVEAGCDCVKFQSWSENSLYSQTYYRENPMAKRFVKKFALTPEELKQMAVYCSDHGIGFSSTPYSKEEVDFLVEQCQVPFIKISSMEINNLEYLEYIGKKGLPIILSTGMSDLDEIDIAIKRIENTGNRSIILLHCVSIYPTQAEDVNLNVVLGLREKYPMYPIGFSDHTLGDTAAIAATALGAAVIEKHITLDAKKVGMDNQMAMEPEDLKRLVSKCRDANRILGSKEKVVNEMESEQRMKMRRSVVTTKKIQSGHILTREDLTAKRPGTGISLEHFDEVIGKRVNKDIEADSVLYESDIDI